MYCCCDTQSAGDSARVRVERRNKEKQKRAKIDDAAGSFLDSMPGAGTSIDPLISGQWISFFCISCLFMAIPYTQFNQTDAHRLYSIFVSAIGEAKPLLIESL